MTATERMARLRWHLYPGVALCRPASRYRPICWASGHVWTVTLGPRRNFCLRCRKAHHATP